MYKYHIYGLGIESEVRLYRLEECAGEAKDVWIHYGTMEPEVTQQIEDGISSAMNQNRVWFRNEIGVFLIRQGKEIVIQPVPGAKEEDIACFVLGWCIAFLFQQRGVSAIHCSALEMHGQAVLVSGASGSGKSTLALELLRKGYRYLADDIAMVEIENDFLIQPAFPQQKVCRDVAEGMEEAGLLYIDEKKDKFAVQNTADFCEEPRKLSTIFLLEKYDGEEVVIDKLKGLDKWNGVAKSLFLLDAYMAMKFPIEEKNRCLAIAGMADVYRIRRPEGKDTVQEICDKIIAMVKANNE